MEENIERMIEKLKKQNEEYLFTIKNTPYRFIKELDQELYNKNLDYIQRLENTLTQIKKQQK